MGAGEQRCLLPPSPKSLHADENLGFPYHPSPPPSSTIHKPLQNKSFVEQNTKYLTLETLMSELCEVMGDMSLKLCVDGHKHGPLHETHNRSQGTKMDPMFLGVTGQGIP